MENPVSLNGWENSLATVLRGKPNDSAAVFNYVLVCDRINRKLFGRYGHANPKATAARSRAILRICFGGIEIEDAIKIFFLNARHRQFLDVVAVRGNARGLANAFATLRAQGGTGKPPLTGHWSGREGALE